MAAAARQIPDWIASFDPDDLGQPVDVIELGARGIYREVTRSATQSRADWAWEHRALPAAKAQHRREASACLRAAGVPIN